MSIKIRRGGEWVEPSKCKIRQAGTWREIKQIQVYSGGAWRIVANFTGSSGGSGGEFDLNVNPTSINDTSAGSFHQTDLIQVTPDGGVSPYTYEWEVVSQDAGPTYSFTAGNKAKTRLNANGVTVGTFHVAVQCTATDSLGSEAVCDPVTITIRRFS